MNMKPNLRKFALTAHITLSVGWLGAVAGFLALAVAGLTSHDVQLVRGLYLAMGVTGRYAIVPLCLASLLTGFVMSLGTKWGLFRHYWVMAKFLLTIVSTLILFGFIRTLGYIGVLAADTTMSIDELRNLSQSPVLHSGGGLLVLLVVTTLSVYKPWGRTRYGLRTQREQHEVLLADLPSRPESDVEAILGSTSRTPRWVSVVGILAIVMTLLFLVAHLAGGGMIHSFRLVDNGPPLLCNGLRLAGSQTFPERGGSSGKHTVFPPHQEKLSRMPQKWITDRL